MEVIEFESSVVTRDDGKITIAVFDGAPVRACVAIFECREEAALSLRRSLGSVLNVE
jgi:hypothetical protein